MRVLYIYRNSQMGYSIGKVFKPVEEEMRKYADVDSIELPCGNYSLRSMWYNIKVARNKVKNIHYDIIHITGAEHYLLPFLRKENTVVTVHDLGFFTNNKFGLRAIKKYFLWIKTLPLASYITFISEKSEQEALKLVALKHKRYSVVFNPIGKEYMPYPRKFNTEHPVILHIGTKENKNLESTVIALKDFPCTLRIVGKLTEKQKLILDIYHIQYECVSNLTDEEILQEYIHCDYVNFPSLYEGFGMPIIEGQAFGRPVLTSCLLPMKEVANDAAVIVDPTKPEEIRGGYEQMKEETDKLVERGYENVKRFALNEITKQFFDIYKKILGV